MRSKPSFFRASLYLIIYFLILSLPVLDTHISSFWWVLGVLFVTSIMQSNNFFTTFSSAVLLSASAYLAMFIPQFLLLSIVIFLFIMLIWPQLRLPAIWLLLIQIINSIVPISFPGVGSLAATAMLTLLAGLAVNYYYQINLQHYYFKKISELQYHLFAAIQHPDYQATQYLLERRIALAKYKCQQILQNLQLHPLYSSYRELYLLLIDAGEIRFRIKDAATFHLCEQEITNIRVTLASILSALKQNKTIKNHSLLMRIKSLEDSFHHVLKISAPDPLVFVIFISSLIRLDTLLQLIAAEE